MWPVDREVHKLGPFHLDNCVAAKAAGINPQTAPNRTREACNSCRGFRMKVLQQKALASICYFSQGSNRARLPILTSNASNKVLKKSENG